MGRHWGREDIPDQTGRVAVVTGANAGLGLSITEALAGAGAHVVMGCRNVAKAQAAADALTALRPGTSVAVEHLDLADLSSVEAFAERVSSHHDHLDLLANNAGLMAVDESRTVDGFEMQFGVNHLGHFALTAGLLPVLTATPGSRVATMASFGHRPGRIDLDDPNFERRSYSRWGAYFQSKLANVSFTLELQRRLAVAGAPTVAVAAHPGYVRTELGREGTSLSNRMVEVGYLVAQGPDGGALPLLRAATDPSVEGGTFWGPRWMLRGAPVRENPSRRARDPDRARRLWELSERLTGLHPFA